MITKTIKTILFASLIAAMILPFSTMDFAEAQESKKVQTTAEKLAKIKIMKDEIQYRDGVTSGQSTNTDNIVIQRLEIIEELLVVKELIDDGTLNEKFAKKYTKFLLKKIDKKFNDRDSVPLQKGEQIVDELAYTTQSISTTNFQTSTQTKFNCDDFQYDVGYNWGTVTGLDFIESYVVGVQGYPNNIDTLTNNYCTEKLFDDGYVKYRNVSTGGMCTGDLPSANSVAQGYCAKFGVGAPVLITAYAWYNGSVPFNTAEGWDFIWVS